MMRPRGRWRDFVLVVLMTCLMVEWVHSYVNFSPGHEYEYHYDSTVTLQGIGDFVLRAKIGFQKIDDVEAGAELAMKIKDFEMFLKSDPAVSEGDLDFSKWFSLEISDRGEIRRFFYPEDELAYIISLKSGFANLLAGKLMHSNETGSTDGHSHSYLTEEDGHEGRHQLSYTVVPTDGGKEIRRRRINYQHDTLNLDTSKEKRIFYSDDLGVVHRIDIDEQVTSLHSEKPGFDPHFAMRDVAAVNEFSDIDYPKMKTSTKGTLLFIAKRRSKIPSTKPDNLTSGGYKEIAKQGTSFHQTPLLEDNLTLDYVHSNLTCLRTKAEQGAPDMFNCYYALLDLLRVLPEKTMRQLAKEYFTRSDTSSRSEEATWMVDVFASANTELSNRILVEVILGTPVNEELLKRWLLHIGASTGSPAKELTEHLLSLVRDEESGVMTGLSKGTRNKIVLSLGALAYQHHTDGDTGTTQAVLDWLHGKLGLHDPWRYRSKRALMSDKEKTAHDLEKVVLLEALGNGRHESSFEFIVSHMNSSISPWVKRSGIHALRHYHTEEAVLEIERAAYTDENEEVRYEARLQYEAHPLANTRTSDDPESSILMAPANSSFVEAHSRHRRSLKDKELKFRLQAPSVDWRKRLGGSSIGASFGVIMINYLDLKMSPLHGWMKIEIHDEVYDYRCATLESLIDR